jgi:hypothetical protein
MTWIINRSSRTSKTIREYTDGQVRDTFHMRQGSLKGSCCSSMLLTDLLISISSALDRLKCLRLSGFFHNASENTLHGLPVYVWIQFLEVEIPKVFGDLGCVISSNPPRYMVLIYNSLICKMEITWLRLHPYNTLLDFRFNRLNRLLHHLISFD